MDYTYELEQIEKIKALIDGISDVLIKLALNPSKSFSINTGQTQESVTEKDIGSLVTIRDGLYNQLVVFEVRVYGNGHRTVIPGW